MILQEEFSNIGTDDRSILPEEEQQKLPQENVRLTIDQLVGIFRRPADLLLAKDGHLLFMGLARYQRPCFAQTHEFSISKISLLKINK